ncbi:hypothetical protein HELRODRAFT_166918 [Helobdella robusta]|uniref:Uncharacterized protein n=1 Tax=Helobdella robusta TaxID=6412 RepID=T1EYR1_HELRO|nr:hypothetical protein HELRODRAFT_166918 [Helobdella robusta]ESO11847.1 hypothetical protein HELRODRAFT_166918 [Helobdella robusta]
MRSVNLHQCGTGKRAHTRYKYFVCRKRLTIKQALIHPFVELSNHRGLGHRISVDRHKSYMVRSRYEVMRGLKKVKNCVILRPLTSYQDEAPPISLEIDLASSLGIEDGKSDVASSDAGSKVSEFGPKLLLKCCSFQRSSSYRYYVDSRFPIDKYNCKLGCTFI